MHYFNNEKYVSEDLGKLYYFDGETFSFTEDSKRLSKQLDWVYSVMRSGRWYTLSRLAEVVHGSECSISARLRDLRKKRFGSHIIHTRHVAGGLWEYSLEIPGRGLPLFYNVAHGEIRVTKK